MTKKLRILLTGGGTGGHIYPIIAVAQKLQVWGIKNGIEPDLRYFGAIDGYRPTLEAAKIKVANIVSSKLRRYFSILNFVDFFKFWIGFLQSLAKLFFYMPEVAFTKGGPGSLPVIFACRFYFIPIVVHESDSVPGLANTIAARSAKILDLAFASAADKFKKAPKNVNVVGNPVRAEILGQTSPAQARVFFGLDPMKSTIAVLGGSQGAEKINDFVLGNLEAFLGKYQVIHQVGKEKYKEYKLQYEFIAKKFSPITLKNYKFESYFENNLPQVMDAADIIISRAGAGAIFEIAAKGKPSLLIPLPDAAGDHQTQNAYEYAQTGAAMVIEQENILTSIVMGQIDKILSDKKLNGRMSAAAKSFFRPDTADRIATHILEQWRP